MVDAASDTGHMVVYFKKKSFDLEWKLDMALDQNV